MRRGGRAAGPRRLEWGGLETTCRQSPPLPSRCCWPTAPAQAPLDLDIHSGIYTHVCTDCGSRGQPSRRLGHHRRRRRPPLPLVSVAWPGSGDSWRSTCFLIQVDKATAPTSSRTEAGYESPPPKRANRSSRGAAVLDGSGPGRLVHLDHGDTCPAAVARARPGHGGRQQRAAAAAASRPNQRQPACHPRPSPPTRKKKK